MPPNKTKAFVKLKPDDNLSIDPSQGVIKGGGMAVPYQLEPWPVPSSPRGSGEQPLNTSPEGIH